MARCPAVMLAVSLSILAMQLTHSVPPPDAATTDRKGAPPNRILACNLESLVKLTSD
ncbi:hypothetical protein GCM10017767_16170 [Halomonas urumqiensis]|nr:hypothetical protein GCM10017767_16170 [Halomonas urumqiensis]